MMVKCPTCKASLQENVKICPYCRHDFEIEEESEDDVEGNWEEENEGEEKETIISIFSLVFFMLAILSSIIGNNMASIIYSIISFSFMVIAHLQKGKCVCATIVFWIQIMGFFVLIIGGLFLNL